MNPRSRVVLLTSKPETAGAITAALNSHTPLELGGVCTSVSELARSLAETPAAAVVVDLDPDPRRMLADLDAVIARFSDTRFVVLSAGRSSDLMLEAMQIGARHFLARETLASDLPGVLRRLVRDHAAGGVARGTVVTVLGASGGCGATTVAVNLANELALAARSPALLVDMDAAYGSVATYLGLEGQYGLADVLAYDGRIDAHLVRSSALAYGESLHVLLSPASINLADPAPLRYEHLDEALEACKHAYAHTVLDAARLPAAVAAALTKASKAVLLVLQLTIKEVRTARSMLTALGQCGVAPGQVTLVVNRYRKRSPIRLDEARKALGPVPVVCVANDFRSAVRGINFGQPLAEVARSSALRRDLARLAAEIARREAPAAITGDV